MDLRQAGLLGRRWDHWLQGLEANPLGAGISSLIPGKGTLISAGAGLLGGALAGGMQPPQQQPGESQEDYQRRVAEFQRHISS
jgi:hypothetical protein